MGNGLNELREDFLGTDVNRNTQQLHLKMRAPIYNLRFVHHLRNEHIINK